MFNVDDNNAKIKSVFRIISKGSCDMWLNQLCHHRNEILKQKTVILNYKSIRDFRNYIKKIFPTADFLMLVYIYTII